MTLTVSRVLNSKPEALIDAAAEAALSAAAAETDIAAERSHLVTLAGQWTGSASSTAQLRGAELLADQERYHATLLEMQKVLAEGGSQLSDIRMRLASLTTSELAVFWQIGDDGSVAPGPLLQEYSALSPVAELQVMLMALGLEREIRQLLAEFELADIQTAESLQGLSIGPPDSSALVPEGVPAPAPPPEAKPHPDNPNPVEAHPTETRPNQENPTETQPTPPETNPNSEPPSATPDTVPDPHDEVSRYETGQIPTMAGSPGDSPRMSVASDSSDQVPLQDNPPGFTGSAGPARDAAWLAYLSQRSAAAPGVVTPALVLPNPDAVSDPGLKTVGAAAKQQGVSYTWGGGHLPGKPGVSAGWRNNSRDGSWNFNDQNRTGFDCSGLARFAAAEGYGFDISAGNIGNTVGQEAALSAPGGNGTVIPDSVLRPGDLIYYGPPGDSHHVVVYGGNGLVVQAQQSGEPVEVSPLNLSEQHRDIRLEN